MTVNGTNLEVKMKETTGTSFQLGTSDIFINPNGLTLSVAGTSPLPNPYVVDIIPSGANTGVSILHNITGGQIIGSIEQLIVSIPITGGSGTPILITGGMTNIFNNAGTPVLIPSADPSGICALIPLPVELLSFKGIKKGKTSQLQWETSNEKNLVNYIIERSPDGRNFHPVGFTKPRSTSANEKVAYDFVDDQPEMGINYYRLLSKGVGKDEKYSKVISLDFGLGLSGRVYPNPLDGELSIDLDIESNTGEVEVGIYDVVGKQVLSKKFQNNDRRVNMTLPTSDLAPGSYFVKVKVGSYNWERQITKM